MNAPDVDNHLPFETSSKIHWLKAGVNTRNANSQPEPTALAALFVERLRVTNEATRISVCLSMHIPIYSVRPSELQRR